MDIEIPRWFQVVALAGLVALSVGCLVWGIVADDWVKYVAAAMPWPMAVQIIWWLRRGDTRPFSPERP